MQWLSLFSHSTRKNLHGCWIKISSYVTLVYCSAQYIRNTLYIMYQTSLLCSIEVKKKKKRLRSPVGVKLISVLFIIMNGFKLMMFNEFYIMIAFKLWLSKSHIFSLSKHTFSFLSLTTSWHINYCFIELIGSLQLLIFCCYILFSK